MAGSYAKGAHMRRLTRFLFRLLLVPLSAAGLAAQIEPGETLPALGELRVLQGQAVPLPPPEPKLAVLAVGTDLAPLRWGFDHLAELRRRFGDKVQVAALLLGEAPATPPPGKGDLPVLQCADADVRSLFYGEDQRGTFWLLLGSDGIVRWVGEPGHGLAEAARALLAGEADPAAIAEDHAMRASLLGAFDDYDPEDAVRTAAALLKRNRTDGAAWGLHFAAAVDKQGDLAQAAAIVQDARKALAMDPWALAAFADLALRTAPNDRALGRLLAEELTLAAPLASGDVPVQLTLLRAHVRAGNDREVGRLSRMLAKGAGESADTALSLAEILTDDATPAVHADTAQKALERAAALGAEPRLLAAARYGVLRRCAGDEAGAAALFAGYVRTHAEQVTLNNDAWYHVTDMRTRGRFGPLALALAERMLENRGQLDDFELDTVALVMFVSGRVGDAVELQKAAIEKGGGGNPNYRARLQRYEAALAAQGPAGGR